MAKRKKSLIGQLIENAVRRAATETTRKTNGGGGFWEDNTRKVKSFSETVREQNAKALRSGTRPTTTTRTLLDTSIKRQQQNNQRMQDAMKRSALTNLQDSVNKARRNAQQATRASQGTGALSNLTRSAIAANQKASRQSRLEKSAYAPNVMIDAPYGASTMRPYVNEKQQSARRELGLDKREAEAINKFFGNNHFLAGVVEEWSPYSPESVMEKEYGIKQGVGQRALQRLNNERETQNGLDYQTLSEARNSKAYTAGRGAAQAAEYLMLMPLYGALGTAGAGAKGFRAGAKALAKRSAVETAINTPLNIVNSAKQADGWNDFLKDFTVSETLDFALGGLFNVPGIRKNVHFNRAMDFNQQALRAAKPEVRDQLQRQAINELKKTDYKVVKNALGDLTPEQSEELVRANLLSRENQLLNDEALVARNRYAQNRVDELQGVYDAGNYGQPVENTEERAYNNNIGGMRNAAENTADARGVRTGESNVREAFEGVPEQPEVNPAYVERGADSGGNGFSGEYVPISEAQRRALNEAGVTNANLRGAEYAPYSNALDNARTANRYGAYVDPQTPEELTESGAKAFMSDDGSVGIAVKSDGNIVGAYNNNTNPAYRGSATDMLLTARANGGTKMDCYGRQLVNKYERAGFVPVARVRFNPDFVDDPLLLANKPDIYVMMKNADGMDTVVNNAARERYHYSTQEELDALPVFDDITDANGETVYGYDRALDYRDDLLARQEAGNNGVKTIRESTPEEMFDPEIRAQQDARINDARTQAEEISGVDKYGNPRAVNNQRVTQGVRQAEAGASSPEATRVINEDTYVRGENASVGRGVRETQEDAYLRWRDNPDNALYRLTQATDGLRKQDQIPKGYQSLQEYFADVHEGLSYYQNMQNTATDAITRQRAIEGEANVLEASWKVASNIGSGFRQYQELLRGTWQGQLEMINRQIENIEKRYAKVLKGKKITRLDPDDSLTAMLKTAIQSEDSEVMAEAMHDISVWIWDQVPASKMEKANAWRMTAMLMNPRTHARNIIGNALFRPAVAIKDFIGTGAERYAIRRGLVNREDATKAVVNRFSREGKELREAARASWDANMRTIRGESKYYENARTGLANRPMTQLTRDGKKISVESGVWSAGRDSDNPIVRGFRKGLDSISGLNSTALDFEDVVFMRSKYVDSYAKVLKARGWDPANLTAEQAEAAMEAAGEEALRSTYRDASSLANALNKWKRVDPSRSAGGKTLSWFIETELPFTKTPINIVRRAKDYSPAGLVEGLVRVGRAANAKDSKAMVAAIDRLCSGATGTGIFAIGAWLSNMGIVNGQLKEGDEGWYQQDLGYQNYALNIGGDNGFSVTLDWAAPLSMPFFVGAEVGALYDEGELTLDNLIGAAGRSLNPMMELSVMQGPANTLESLSGDGGKGEKLTQGAIGLGLNYIGQFKPTLSGQIARTIDPVRRNTTSDKDSASAKAIDKWVKKQKASIPFVSRQLPAYQTVWGEEERASDNVGVRILNNFFNPAYVKNKKVDAVDKEIMRLNEADPSEVILPTKLSGFKVGLDGEDIKLNSEDVTLYNRVKGKESKLLIRQLIQTKDYKDAADADKRKMIKDVFTDSGKKAKREALINHGEDPWRVYAADLSGRKKENVEQAKAAGFEPEQWFELQQGRPWDTNGNGNTSNAELITWINGLDLTSEQKALLFDTNKANKKSKNPYAGGATTASVSSSKKGRSGGRRRSGGRSGGKSKARAKTATEKAFTAATSAKLRSDIKSIDFNKINGSMSRSQRKALLKLIQKELKA